MAHSANHPEQLERLVSDAKIILWEAALPSLTFTYVSPQAEAILGYPVGRWYEPGFWMGIIHPDDRDAAVAYCAERTRLGLDHEFEYRLVAADGRAVWVRDIVTVVRGKKQTPEGLRGAMMDISSLMEARNQAERALASAQAASLAKTRFLAAASHDLRQPVQAMRLLMHLLMTRPVDAKTLQLLEHMQEALASTEGMLTKLMEFAALQSGKVVVARESFRIDEVVQRVAREVAGEATAKGLSLRVRTFPCISDSDPVLVERIIRNLASNAIRYTARGGVLLGIRRRSNSVAVVVCDTGPGIPSNMQSVVFEEFEQIGNPERDRNKGVGLGLAIVARTAELLGHRIGLRSIEGKGSVFWVELPYVGGVSAASEGVQPADKPRGRILVVEDDDLQAMALSYLLEGAGFSVAHAASAHEAISLLDQSRLDLILTDYRLPGGVSGIQTITMVRQHLDRYIPALVVTGDTGAAIAEEAAMAAATILHKPYAPEALLAAINQQIGNAHY